MLRASRKPKGLRLSEEERGRGLGEGRDLSFIGLQLAIGSLAIALTFQLSSLDLLLLEFRMVTQLLFQLSRPGSDLLDVF
jgi:hypothetical protein